MDKVEMEVYLAAVEAEEVESLKTAMEYIGKAFDALGHVCSEDCLEIHVFLQNRSLYGVKSVNGHR